ncbi:MAG: contractile injection system tape measure protein [bacterium]
MRAGLRDVVDGEVRAALAALLDERERGDDVLHVPRLAVRVVGSAGDLRDGRLTAAVVDQLRRVLGAQQLRADRGSRRARRQETEIDLLAAYLRGGVLPWFASSPETPVAVERLRDAARRDPASVVTRLLGLPWINRREALRRLLQLIEPDAWEDFAGHTPIHAAAGARLYAVLRAVAARYAASVGERQRFAAVLLAVHDVDDARLARTELAALLDDPTDDPGVTALRTALDDCLRTITARHASAAPPPPTESTTVQGSSADRPAATAARQVLEPVDEAEANHTATDLPILAPHAGLVLLHPFLPQLFAATGMRTTADGSLEPAALPIAATLLCYLATGRSESHDLELPFIKVLLGLRPETELPASGRRFASSDAAEAEALLSAARGHWRALKRTSTVGLQTAFLQRPGLLDEDAQGWRLRVEPRGYDALLDHLPWGFRLAVLPWLRRPLVTEWPTR